MCRVDGIISFHAAIMLSTLQRSLVGTEREREKRKKDTRCIKKLLKIYKCLPGSNLLTYPDRLFLISFPTQILRQYLISDNNFFLPVLSNSPSWHYSHIVYKPWQLMLPLSNLQSIINYKFSTNGLGIESQWRRHCACLSRPVLGSIHPPAQGVPGPVPGGKMAQAKWWTSTPT